MPLHRSKHRINLIHQSITKTLTSVSKKCKGLGGQRGRRKLLSLFAGGLKAPGLSCQHRLTTAK